MKYLQLPRNCPSCGKPYGASGFHRTFKVDFCVMGKIKLIPVINCHNCKIDMFLLEIAKVKEGKRYKVASLPEDRGESSFPTEKIKANNTKCDRCSNTSEDGEVYIIGGNNLCVDCHCKNDEKETK